LDTNSQECAYTGLHIIYSNLKLYSHGSNVSTERLETLFERLFSVSASYVWLFYNLAVGLWVLGSHHHQDRMCTQDW